MSDQERVEQWIKKIDNAEKHYEQYHSLIKEIRKYYKNGSKKNKHNIFWASVETLKPFLYFKQPVPVLFFHLWNMSCYIVEENRTIDTFHC